MTESSAPTLSGLDIMERDAKVLAAWCPSWVGTAIRHVVRNCDVECFEHGRDCWTPDRDDGRLIPTVGAFAVSLVTEVRALRAELERLRRVEEPCCCNPDCDRPGTVYVGDLTTLGDYACSLCEVYIVGDGNDD